jgi:hypothetical protein
MTGLRDFHTSVFDFATKVMTAFESRHGSSGRSSQVTATIAFGESDESRGISISCTARRCIVVWSSKDSSMESKDVEANGSVRGRGPPPTARPPSQGAITSKPRIAASSYSSLDIDPLPVAEATKRTPNHGHH